MKNQTTIYYEEHEEWIMELVKFNQEYYIHIITPKGNKYRTDVITKNFIVDPSRQTYGGLQVKKSPSLSIEIYANFITTSIELAKINQIMTA